jgi:hypothetical protein
VRLAMTISRRPVRLLHGTWQVQWKEHQSADSSAQVLLMNVPVVLDTGGVKI